MASAAKKGRDRRLHPRFSVKVNTKADVQLFGNRHTYALHTVNISETGLLLESDAPLTHFNPSTILEVKLHIETEDEPLYIVCKYVRSESPTCIGVRISEMDLDVRRRYQHFLDHAAQSHTVIELEDSEDD